jgi:hypothetical protein
MLHQNTITQAKSEETTQTIAFQFAGGVSEEMAYPGYRILDWILINKIVYYSIAA